MEDIVKSYKNQVPGPFLLTEAILFSSSAEKIKAKYIFKTFFILVFQILNWLIIFFFGDLYLLYKEQLHSVILKVMKTKLQIKLIFQTKH